MSDIDICFNKVKSVKLKEVKRNNSSAWRFIEIETEEGLTEIELTADVDSNLEVKI